MSIANEPLLSAAIVTSVIGALITLLRAFGVPLTPDQQQAISAFVALVAPIAMALYARPKVTPLIAPKDELGRELSGPNGEPTVAQTRAALKM